MAATSGWNASSTKAITAHSAWSRLFNETMTGLRFDATEPMPLEADPNFFMHPDERKRQAAAQSLAKVFKENGLLFTHITNTLANKEISDRWRGSRMWPTAATWPIGSRVKW